MSDDVCHVCRDEAAAGLREQLRQEQARADVYDGTSCAEERDAGNDRCCMCVWCLRQRAEAAEAEVARLRDALGRVEIVLTQYNRPLATSYEADVLNIVREIIGGNPV